MRSAGNFHPEWGYLASAPSFMRTVRVALVATAIGAVAGAVVVVSLVERPGSSDESGIAAHALLTRAPVIAPPTPASRAGEPGAVKPATASVPSQPSMAAIAPSAPSALAAPAKAAAHEPSTVASAGKTDKPDKADSISPPLPLAAPTGAAIASTAPVAAGAAAEADAPVAADRATAAPTPVKRYTAKRRHYQQYRRPEAAGARRRWHDNGGFGPLFRLFSFRTGSPYSSN